MKPVWKWVVGIVVALLLIVLAASWYVGRNWKPILETKLKEAIHESTDGLYSLNYEDLDLKVVLGNVTLTNAELIPDSIIYKQLVEAEKAPNNRFHIKLSSLKIRRFNLLGVLTNRKLDIKNIELESPKIHILHEHHAFNDSIPEENPDEQSKTLHDHIQEVLSSVGVNNIELKNVGFKYSKIANGKSSVMELDSIQIRIRDVLIDETSLQDTSRLYYTKMVDVYVPGFEYDLPDGYYRAKFDGLHINTENAGVLLTNVSYAPKMSKSTFYKKRNRDVTMADLKFDTLRVEGLDFQSLIDKQQTIARSAQVKNGSVAIYQDKRYYKDPKSHIGNAPHQRIMRLKALINIDTVYVNNIGVLYGEMSGKYHQEGIITFDHATGIITNVTNDSTALANDKFMRADLRAKIMDAGNLHAKFGFDMLSKNGYHTYSGTLGATQAPIFNRILKPLLNVEIGSGNIRKITFNMEGNDRRNWGDFRFDYDNLKIRLLGEKDETGRRQRKRILSFLVNQVIINDSNPDANEKYHVGKVNYRRVPEHTFWKTLWQSLLDGIKQTAGISPDREAKLMERAKSAQNTVKGTKSTVQKTKSTAQRTGGFVKGLFRKKDREAGDSGNEGEILFDNEA